jgi:hypothetical protein
MVISCVVISDRRLKSRANECFDSFPKDLQDMIKDLGGM